MGDAGLPPLPSLPVPKLSTVSHGICLLEPLSRRGYGPPLIVLTSDDESSSMTKNYVPSSVMKWAEEGFVIVQVQESAANSAVSILQNAVEALRRCDKSESKKIGIVAYDVSVWNAIRSSLISFPEIVGAVIYSDVDQGLQPSPIPCVQHLHGKARFKLPRTPDLTAYEYPTSKSQTFASSVSPDFDYALEAVSHTRNLTFFKRPDVLAGPIFDLEEIWDEHTYYEFENRSIPHTMATMVQEPYVNHVPTLTGGIGREELTDFYTNHFIFSNPDDVELELISRTVGIDRVVDEFVFKCTHNRTIDWLLPTVPPTNVYLEVPMMAIVNIRGDRLYHEHISWDQATVLRQIGVLPEYLPWKTTANQPPSEIQIPVAGKETAMKMREKSSVPSNAMFAFKMRQL